MTAFLAQYLPYTHTQAFSSIATDYVAQAAALQPFYEHAPTIEGIKNAIAQRANVATNRSLLVAELKKQYEGFDLPTKLRASIDSLLQDNSFTITTAHQPNIFTGHLYFIYKILHAIKLAEALQTSLPGHQFVPVYYMGSEDADLDELGAVSIDGKEYRWHTKQQGAVGRMKVDKEFIALINEMEGQLSVEPHGAEILSIVRSAYTLGASIEQATFKLVHELFGQFGLVVLLPDNAALKSQMIPLIRKELQEQFSSRVVNETMAAFPESYKVQAAGREINLFYLKDDLRERIEKAGDGWMVVNTDLQFTHDEMLAALQQHPERFSPNVILRPVYQELIL
ncbi:MAG: bacillithiol biosynthesis BshC, partial [Chitinophagaceae bacterium]